jgi:hypothetical protein
MLDNFCILAFAEQCNIDINLTKPTKTESTKKDTFKFPIEYLTDDYSIPENVATDLELFTNIVDPSATCMYKHLFKPSNEFARNTMNRWTKYTTNQSYLTETQQIIKNIDKSYLEDVSCNEIIEIWDSLKKDEGFLERYSYMEWECLYFLNTTPAFLQAISMANMISPVLSLLFPVLFLIMPFILLKIQGIPIDVSTYLDVLKDIAKHHFIGKSISSIEKLDVQNVVYLVFTTGLYLYQIYQNSIMCMRFYRNIERINVQLIKIQSFVKFTMNRMKHFKQITATCNTYSEFTHALSSHIETLERLDEEMSIIQPFEVSIFKINEIGILMKMYYILHSDSEYEEALLYAFDFEGYYDNLCGVRENIDSGIIHGASFNNSSSNIIGQYYPAIAKKDAIANNYAFNKNAIITGPNASGKTTFLKTTTINIIFTQQVGCGYYESCELYPYSHIHSYLNIPDTSGRDSLFQAESRRCKEIIDLIDKKRDGSHHFAIFDELYSGTNPVEASKSAYAFLLYLTKYENVDFILTTHYTSVCKRLKKEPRIKCMRMSAIEKENDEIEYLYKIEKGVSKIQGAIKVLQQMNYPQEIIDNIHKY